VGQVLVLSTTVDVKLLLTAPWVKKQDTNLLPITSPNVNRFSKFFREHTQWYICNKLKYSTTPDICRYTTLWNMNARKLAVIWYMHCDLMFFKSQGNIAKHLFCFDRLFHCKFSTQFAGERIFKSVNIWRSYKQNGWLHNRPMPHSPCTFVLKMRNSPHK